MRRIFLIIMACLLMFSGMAFARDVTVTGHGATAKDAENDALKTAVENAVGVMVDSTVIVENFMLIDSQIYL